MGRGKFIPPGHYRDVSKITEPDAKTEYEREKLDETESPSCYLHSDILKDFQSNFVSMYAKKHGS